jgi:hypothetical protein
MKKTQTIQAIFATTFTPLYDELEDRIRLSVNYQDINNRIDFMLTRKFIIKMIPTIDDFIDKFYPALRDEMDGEQFTSAASSPTKPQEAQTQSKIDPTDRTDLNLLKKEGVLLREIKLSFNPDTKKSVLLLISKDRAAQATLDAQSLYKIVGIIKKSIPNYAWGISPYL